MFWILSVRELALQAREEMRRGEVTEERRGEERESTGMISRTRETNDSQRLSGDLRGDISLLCKNMTSETTGRQKDD